MITHILYQLMGKFSIAGEGFRKVLACFISIMFFGLLYTIVRFTGMQIPNFNRNLVMLTAIDLGGFWFLTWKNKVPEVVPEPPSQPEVNEPANESVNEPVNEPVKQLEQEITEPVTTVQNQEDEDVEKLMNEIIEENKERKEQIEKEMGEN